MDEDRYSQLLEEVRAVLSGAGGLAAAVGLLQDRLPHFSWVGFYFLEGDELVLGPWRGPAATEHVRIPIGAGICGAAAVSGEAVVVDDVAGDGRYLACFPSTRSEIVVPVRRGERVVGELDVDSDRPAAFGPADRRLLEQIAVLVADHLAQGWSVTAPGWLVDEWGRESFPASDAPACWAGRDEAVRRRDRRLARNKTT
jgi:L-methionine (R)-S-oxide reductase